MSSCDISRRDVEFHAPSSSYGETKYSPGIISRNNFDLTWKSILFCARLAFLSVQNRKYFQKIFNRLKREKGGSVWLNWKYFCQSNSRVRRRFFKVSISVERRRSLFLEKQDYAKLRQWFSRGAVFLLRRSSTCVILISLKCIGVHSRCDGGGSLKLINQPKLRRRSETVWNRCERKCGNECLRCIMCRRIAERE